jgi:hypothetical protein
MATSPQRREPVHQQIRLVEPGQGIVAPEAGQRPRGEPGVEQHVAVRRADEVGRDGDLRLVGRELAVEQQRPLGAHEPVV